MAQDEIGHALTYYRLLNDLGEADPDALAFRRGADQFRCAHLVEWPREDWAFSLTRQFLYDAAETVRLAALSGSSYMPLAQAARKLAGEEKYHLMHGRAWLVRLGRAAGESQSRMQAALDKAFPLALGLFEAGEAEAELVKQGVKPPEAELRREWQALSLAVLDEAGLRAPSVTGDGGALRWQARPPHRAPGASVGRHAIGLSERSRGSVVGEYTDTCTHRRCGVARICTDYTDRRWISVKSVSSV
jgi:ring-1,2-phenylacetyl-CoA epoxidase subunit PaaC